MYYQNINLIDNAMIDNTNPQNKEKKELAMEYGKTQKFTNVQ